MDPRGADTAQVESELSRAAETLGGGDAPAAVAMLEALETPPELEPAKLGLLGHARHRMGDTEGAASALARGRSLSPEDPGLANAYGLVLLSMGRADAGVAQLKDAVRLSPAPEPLANLMRTLVGLWRYEEALEVLEQRVADRPDDMDAWAHAGVIRRTLGDLAGSEAALRRALELAADQPNLLCELASTLKAQERAADAEVPLRRALELDPDHGRALTSLASLMERTHRLQEAMELAGDRPRLPQLVVLRARCERRSGDTDTAIRRLRALLAGLPAGRVRADACFELGDCLEAAGEDASAFTAYAEGNGLMDRIWETLARGEDPQVPMIRRCIERFTEDWVAGWSPTPRPEQSPMFLVGFPRSGTTLLERMLDAHPEIDCIPERPLLEPLLTELGRRGLYPDRMDQLDEEEIRDLQQRFLRAAREAVAGDAPHLLHKMPLDSARLGLIHRLFPDARILLALRHPADVVLSCFMQQFEPTHSMAHFHDLRRAAGYYDLVMSSVEAYRSVLPLALHEVRYEDLVSDAEATARGVLEHLGLSWDPVVLDRERRTREGGAVRTPSYEQVSQPIYTRACGRWRRYRDQLAPALPVLQPWVERFGYTVEAGTSADE